LKAIWFRSKALQDGNFLKPFVGFKQMKRFFKWSAILLFLLASGLVVSVLLRQNRKFEAPFPEIAASQDSAIIAKGKYLFYGPANCMDCHAAPEDLEKVEKGVATIPKGGRTWHLPVGILRIPNISSDPETGLGKRSDQEIARSLRYGVAADGHALFDFMPFHNTSDADLQAIISFLRTLPAEKNAVSTFEPNTLGMVLNAFVFKPVGPDGPVLKEVQADSGIGYGKYLATSVANCRGCHTNRDLKTGAFVGPEYAGGFAMPVDGKDGEFVVTCNLTPDPETGRMADWTEERFIQRFREGKKIPQSHMPWGPFRSFSDRDLKAIFSFLKSLDPVKNETGPVLLKEKVS
jgi:mono/diheme cytochrome c family protein